MRTICSTVFLGPYGLPEREKNVNQNQYQWNTVERKCFGKTQRKLCCEPDGIDA